MKTCLSSLMLACACACAQAGEAYVALDDARVEHPRKVCVGQLRDSWRQVGTAFVRPLAIIREGVLDFRTALSLPKGLTATVDFLSCDERVVKSTRISGDGIVHVRFRVTEPVAALRISPSKPISGLKLMRGPLHISVNEAVDETFDAVKAGTLPPDWSGSKAQVTTHLASLGPWDANGSDYDPFLSLPPGGQAKATFSPVQGRQIVSFQTYADERSVLSVTLPDGAKVNLQGLSYQFPGGVTYAASAGVWYTIRFETDQGKTRIKINGRDLATVAAAAARSGELLFAASGSVASAVDDVRVFAHEDTADGVPEPIVPQDKAHHTVGINVCSLWREGTHYGWDCVAQCQRPKPVLGFYDEGEGESADWEIKYMVEHGIDFQAFCWYGDKTASPIKHPRLRYQLDDGFKNAKWSNKMGYCLIWECVNAAVPVNADSWRRYYVPYFIEHHFKDPRYVKIQNRLPLYTFVGSKKLAKMFGGVAALRREFDYLDAQVKALGFDGVIYVASHEQSRPELAQMGYGATAAYNWGYEGYRFDVNTNRNWRNARDKSCFTIPTISVGFDHGPWNGPSMPMMSPEVLEKSLTWARDVFGPATAAKGTWQDKLYMISTWNEYGEGTYLMPTEDARGFGYLDAVRKVFTDEAPDPKLNQVPTPEQRTRMCRLFRYVPVGEWTKPEQLAAWTRQMFQVSAAQVTNDVLRVVCKGWDAQLYSDTFRLSAQASQQFVFEARTTVGGSGELFWMKPGEGPAQRLSTHFDWIGDGAWHVYRIRPFWQGEGKIGRLRLDFPVAAANGGVYEIRKIRITNDAPAELIPAQANPIVTMKIRSSERGFAKFSWVNGSSSVRHTQKFRYAGDGRDHTYCLDLAGIPSWEKMIVWTNLTLEAGAQAGELRFVSEDCRMPADLVVENAHMEEAINRVGQEVPLLAMVRNFGTVPATGVTVTAEGLPSGVTCANAAAQDVDGLDRQSFRLVLKSAEPCAFTARLKVSAPGIPETIADVPVRITAALNLPKAAYVPEPQPVKTPYEIGALYFPGWNRSEAWQRVWKRCPERKPVLGWYDEANPEVVDWQIKWLVENGIGTLYVDWYWQQGRQHLEHWVRAFQHARYRHYLKWALMWANHTPKGTHSVEDQRKVTKYWIDNYFCMPEYLQIDGKPVVWYWQAENMNRDLGAGGCKKLLDLSRQMAIEAGYKGIHFIAMKWPEADCSAPIIQRYKDMGFDMTGIYHFMSPGKRFAGAHRFPYSAVADANPANWWDQQKADVLPFLPNLSTGWDDRPWNDSCEIYGKNAADFRRICRAAKDFADKTGVKRLCLAPLNEWGEGSYAEPNAELGFGFYEAVRDTFCEKPSAGWPLNYAPKDVGLGPYDLPLPKPPLKTTSWNFTGGDALGWHGMMGIEDFSTTPQGLQFKTSSRDPALTATFVPFAADAFTKVVVRMKVNAAQNPGAIQLFWWGPGGAAQERTSATLPIKADGTLQTYELPVAKNIGWKRKISSFRLDPGNRSDLQITLQSLELQ